MTEKFPEDYLEVAEKGLANDECLCVGGDKNGACDNCEFRKEAERQVAESKKVDE
jgi:hypothetical protein